MNKDISKKTEKRFSEQRLKNLMDDNLPLVKNYETIEQWEERNGRGFWGNSTTGYHKNDT